MLSYYGVIILRFKLSSIGFVFPIFKFCCSIKLGFSRQVLANHLFNSYDPVKHRVNFKVLQFKAMFYVKLCHLWAFYNVFKQVFINLLMKVLVLYLDQLIRRSSAHSTSPSVASWPRPYLPHIVNARCWSRDTLVARVHCSSDWNGRSSKSFSRY